MNIIHVYDDDKFQYGIKLNFSIIVLGESFFLEKSLNGKNSMNIYTQLTQRAILSTALIIQWSGITRSWIRFQFVHVCWSFEMNGENREIC